MTDPKADNTLRELLRHFLSCEDAHASFDSAVQGVPTALRGERPEGQPHSLWQLLEHMRITQHDILDFCRNAAYVELEWPKDYWPATVAPPSSAAWDESIAAYIRDRTSLAELCSNDQVDLYAPIPHGTGQTILRELVLVIDHNAYHLGQFVQLRRQLDSWRD